MREHSYSQLILPTLNYYASIWDPYYQNAINKIKKIQHHAASFVLPGRDTIMIVWVLC